MHILWVPSFFSMKSTRAPQGETLVLISDFCNHKFNGNRPIEDKSVGKVRWNSADASSPMEAESDEIQPIDKVR